MKRLHNKDPLQKNKAGLFTFLRTEIGTAKGLEKEIGKKENFAQIGVYFQSLNTKLIYEEPKYEVTNVI